MHVSNIVFFCLILYFVILVSTTVAYGDLLIKNYQMTADSSAQGVGASHLVKFRHPLLSFHARTATAAA